MRLSEFCKAIHYNNLMETDSCKELANQLKSNLIGNYVGKGKIAAPYSIESQLEDDGVVIIYRDGTRYLLDYRTNEVYKVKNLFSVPFGEYMRKLEPHVDDMMKNQLEDYLLGNIKRISGGPDDEYAEKHGVTYDYVLESTNKRYMIWYKKEDEDNGSDNS